MAKRQINEVLKNFRSQISARDSIMVTTFKIRILKENFYKLAYSAGFTEQVSGGKIGGMSYDDFVVACEASGLWTALQAKGKAQIGKQRPTWKVVSMAGTNADSLRFTIKPYRRSAKGTYYPAHRTGKMAASGKEINNAIRGLKNNVVQPVFSSHLIKPKGRSGTTFHHGETLEPEFGVGGQKDLLTGASPSPGAKGTNTDASIRQAFKMALKSFTEDGKMWVDYAIYTERVIMQDVIGLQSSVTQNWSIDKFINKLHIGGELAPGTPALDRIVNSGEHDRELQAQIVAYLSDNKTIIEWVNREIDGYKHPWQWFKLMWASPNPEKAFIDIGIANAALVVAGLETKGAIRVKKNRNLLKIKKRRATTKYYQSAKRRKTKASALKHTARGAVIKAGRKRAKARTAANPLALRNLLNEALPGVIASKMTSPQLVFRTGRFAQSADVKDVRMGPRGGLSINYDYMKMPYQTFEPGFRQGSTQRDPRKIIGESIRQIAAGIVGDRFMTIRRM